MVQLQLLNVILDKKDSSIILFNNLSDEYFCDYPNEYNYIKSHLNEYGTIPDKVSFLDKFPDFEVLQVNEPTSYLLNELYNDYNTRFLAKTFNSVRHLLENGKTEEAMKVYLNASNDLSKAVPLDCVDITQDTSRYDSYVDKCQDFSHYYIKTGFNELDDLIGGWDKSEELATIAARPGVGKSWILLKMAIAALEQGLKVGLYSGEMSERKVGYRFDTLVSHLSNSSLLRGNINVEGEYKQYIDNLKTRYKGSLKVLTPTMINGPAGVTALRAFVEKEKLDILFVDQHSLLEDDRKAKNPVEKAANISKDLKNLQVLKQIPIIAVSQQNRSEFNNSPSTANIAQSDRISQDSTIVIFIEQKDGVLTLHLTKARDSVNDKHLKYVCDFDKGIFQFLPNDGTDAQACEKLKDEFESDNCLEDDVF
nr:MAG TPA: Helicase, ATPase, REPLICATION [Caudoviricetes sp.]